MKQRFCVKKSLGIHHKLYQKHTTGPGCSKLTTSLVNEMLKFETLYLKYADIFCWKKSEKLLQCKIFSHFLTKNISVFGYEVVKHLTSWSLNDLIKLTMVWTTGPWCIVSELHSEAAVFPACKRLNIIWLQV